jgi:hypothetical protein
MGLHPTHAQPTNMQMQLVVRVNRAASSDATNARGFHDTLDDPAIDQDWASRTVECADGLVRVTT